MTQIVSVHSFRGGTGKSNLTANLALQLAQRGQRVGVVDTDLASPGIHVLFGMDGARVDGSLNDYLFDRRTIAEVSHRVGPPDLPGEIQLVPASVRAGEITRVLRDGYEAQRLVRGLRDLVTAHDLTVLLIDTHPGLGEETLLSLAISDTVLTVLRPDQQDYEGTAVLGEVAAGLGVHRQGLVVNKVPATLDTHELRARVQDAYGAAVVGVLAHDDDVMLLASADVFTLRFPHHRLTTAIGETTDWVLAGTAP